MYSRLTFLIALLIGVFAPVVASAHEVYVLASDVIQKALAEKPFSEWEVLLSNQDQFMFWAVLAVIVVASVFFISISRRLEQVCDPFLAKLPKYAPLLSRITIALSFFAAAYNRALFGPELPLAKLFPNESFIVTCLLVLMGIMFMVGYYTRVAALISLGLFAAAYYVQGSYLLTYANYAGEFIALLILGAHAVGFHEKIDDHKKAPRVLLKLKEKFAPLAFPLLRVAFGLSFIYASLYAKVLHNHLALAVTEHYPALVSFFGFEPHFLILGAAIIEITLGLFFMLGIEIRFTSLFVFFWLSLSLVYFKEAVWPHVVLIGIPIAFICYGYDKYSIEGLFFKREGREPIL